MKTRLGCLLLAAFFAIAPLAMARSKIAPTIHIDPRLINTFGGDDGLFSMFDNNEHIWDDLPCHEYHVTIKSLTYCTWVYLR
jgi:hypothetical protein